MSAKRNILRVNLKISYEIIRTMHNVLYISTYYLMRKCSKFWDLNTSIGTFIVLHLQLCLDPECDWAAWDGHIHSSRPGKQLPRFLCKG